MLGVGIEYIPSAVPYFERLRQLEETADRIVVLVGPISFLLASNDFVDSLEGLLKESVLDADEKRAKRLLEVEQIVGILRQRKSNYERRRPTL